MLEKIIKSYICFGLLLYIVLGLTQVTNIECLITFLAMFIPFISFGVILYDIQGENTSYFNNRNLGVLVFLYSIFIIIIYYFLSYHFDKNLFIFSNVDGLYYYTRGMRLKDMPFFDSIIYTINSKWEYGDWGAFTWISSVFRIIPSQLFLGFVHCILGVITALNMFSIGQNIMPRRYAFFAALSFSIASFTLLMHSLTLKESLFVFLIVLSFRLFYDYLNKKTICSLIIAFILALLLVFFRVPVFLILVFSYIVTLILRRTNRVLSIVLIVLAGVLIVSTSYFDTTYEQYLRGGDVDLIIERKNELAMGGGIVNQITDPISALIGPFPSIIPKIRTVTVLYSSGLLFRVLISGFFFLACYYAFIYRRVNLYPLIIFFLINSLGLIISVKGLETRLDFPHLPMMYIAAFWGISLIDWQKRVRRHDIVSSKQYSVYIAMIIAICVLWNLRNIM
jgi:hypothetical protein